MALKAVLLDFHGVVLDDESLRQELMADLLLAENLRPDPAEYRAVCIGRSDRACLSTLLTSRGRVLTADYLDQVLRQKQQQYLARLANLDRLPIYPGLEDLIYKIRVAQLRLAVLGDASRAEISWVLTQAGLTPHVAAIIAGDDLPAAASKPAPTAYQLAIDALNRQQPGLTLTAADCLAVEDSFAGIEAAKAAAVPVLGVAHTYPYQMIHRRANWVVDYLSEIDISGLQEHYGPGQSSAQSSDQST